MPRCCKRLRRVCKRLRRAWPWLRPVWRAQPFRFANRHRGEMVAVINHAPRRLRLTLTALAQLESAYGDADILALLRGFAANGLEARDVQLVLRAGLAGAGEALAQSADALETEGGAAAGAQLAARLLVAAFGEDAAPAQAPSSDES